MHHLPAQDPMRPVAGSRSRVSIGLLLLVGALFFVSQSLFVLPDAAMVALCGLLAVPLCWVTFWRARVRRQAFRDFYLAPDSTWHRWIRGGVVMLGSRLALALALALLLLLGLARAESRAFWSVLLMVALLWPFSYAVTVRLVARQANARFHRLLATRLHLLIWFTVLLLILTAVAFFAAVPDVRGLSLDEAVLRFTAGHPVRSQVLDWGLVVTEGVRALPHWLLQNLGDGLPGRTLALLAWSPVLVREWLFAWPLLLLFQALQDILEGRFNDRLREAGLLQ